MHPVDTFGPSRSEKGKIDVVTVEHFWLGFQLLGDTGWRLVPWATLSGPELSFGSNSIFSLVILESGEELKQCP